MNTISILKSDCRLLTGYSIIAVPGLSTDPRSAWDYVEAVDGKVTGRRVHWLKDDNMLPAFLPEARILAFNHNPHLQPFGRSTQQLVQSICHELLIAIATDRDSEAEKLQSSRPRERPVIFCWT